MKLFKSFILILLFGITISASDHGIYLRTHEKISEDINMVQSEIVKTLTEKGYSVLYNSDVTTPDYIREDSKEHCGFKAKLIVFTSDEFTKLITEKDNKYLIAGFLRVGIYEDPNGVNINIVDPETIVRIVFNDLYENDEVDEYNKIVNSSKLFKDNLVKVCHSVEVGTKVNAPMEPIRDNEDLAESSKDMFMMVGPMTLFNDEDQFPMIYSIKLDGTINAKSISNKFISNLKSYFPSEDDLEYRWSPTPESDLTWKAVSNLSSPDGKAVLVGITRSRTEGISFNIAGSSREEDKNKCPGIDHTAAYPIEILFIEDAENVTVYMHREMFRMDMYFWDAGMSAFMDHMSMPGILEESIKQSLLGKEYKED